MLTDSRKITNGLVIYSVLISDYEKLDFKNDALAGVRANYFNSNLTPQRDKTEITFDNKIYSLSYYMGNNEPFSWKITRNSQPYQKVKKATGGVYCVIFYGENGIINKRQYFNESHNWIRTEYYDFYHENILKAVLSPKNICGIITLKLERIISEEKRETTILYPSTEMPDDSCSGVMYSNSGMIWYDQRFRPEDMPEENTDVEKTKETGFAFNKDNFTDISDDAINLTEADYLTEVVLPEKENSDNVSVSAEENTGVENQYSAYDKIAKILEEAHKTNKDLFGEIITQTADAICEDDFENKTEQEDIVTENIEVSNSDENDSEEENTEFIEETVEDDLAEIVSEAISEADNIASQPTVFEENTVEVTSVTELIETDSECENIEKESLSDDIDNNSIDMTDEHIKTEFEDNHIDTSFDNEKIPACDIVIHTKSGRYSYYGEVDENNCRTGRGRTVTPEGNTSYDGEYLNDKRNGFGVCYYKEGDINYVGNWKDGDREGCGIGYRLSDGTMHAGKWSNNTPNGYGARFSNDGSFLDLCNYIDGKRNGTGVSVDDDGNVVIRKWKDGEVISEITIRN